jgi:drug/metabolite transporter (DMT)-like permease
MPFLGEIAALPPAACWSAVSILFTVAARRVGTLALNQARITLALVVLTAILLITRGTHWAPEADPHHLALLVVSGLIGLTLGDWAFFSAFVHVGPRITTLLMTLAPPFAALLAVPLLHESLGGRTVVGMSVTLMGVVWVVMERSPTSIIPRGHRVQGLVMGALGAFGQALGLVLSKQGMGDVVDPLPATAIRMAAATVGIWIIAAMSGRLRGVITLVRNPVARLATLGATVLGPIIGVWLSLVSVRLTQTGIAATLMALTPVFILPLVVLVQKEKIGFRAVGGALVAVGGVAILFLR